MNEELTTAHYELEMARDDLAHVEHCEDDTDAQARYAEALAAYNTLRKKH